MHLFEATTCRTRLAGSMFIALAALGSGVKAEVVDIGWASDGRFEQKLRVDPGKFAEVCGRLPAGQAVRWAFESSAALDFNVHYHAGKEVVFPSELVGVAVGKDVLTTKLEQDYCWMWTNKSATPTTVTVTMQR